jgi:hypothetical protein
MTAGQHRQADQVDAFFQRRLGDLFGGQADAFVDDLEADIAPLDGNLFRAVAVTVQTRFADQQAQWPTQFVAGLGDFGANRDGLALLGCRR